MPDTNTTPKLPANSGKPSGESGTMIYSGIITGEEYNRKLTGRSALRIYEEMRRSDATVRGGLQVVKLPLLGANYDVESPRVPEGGDQDLMDYKTRFIHRELFDRNINFKTTIKYLLTGVDFGFSVMEKNFDLTEFEKQTRIGLKDLMSRKQTTIYAWQQSDGSPGVTQQVVDGNFDIPLEKLLVFTHDKEGDNYEGISLLRYVFKNYDMKNKLILVDAIAGEKHAVGVPVVTPKEGATPSAREYADAEDILRNMRANEASFIRLAESLHLEMLDQKSGSNKDLLPSINYHDRKIYDSVLAGFLAIGGSSGSGSQALAKDLTTLFMKSEKALADMLISAIQEQVIKQLCDLNFSDNSEGYPKLVVSNISDDDLNVVASSLSALTNAGLITVDPDLEDTVRTKYNLPLMRQEDRDKYDERHAAPNVQPVSKDDKPDDSKGADDVEDSDADNVEEDEKKKEASNVFADASELQRKIIKVAFED